LPGWVARKKREGDALPMVFELIDSYLTQSGFNQRFTKAAVRRLLGTDSGFAPDFLATMREICRVADVVICSTEEQAAMIGQLNPNTVISFDYFGDELSEMKRDFTTSERLKLVWEGQAVTLRNLNEIAPVLNRLKDQIELHIVSDPRMKRYLGRFGEVDSRSVISASEAPIVFHPWEKATFFEHIRACDLAIIPIGADHPMMRGKPENKLVMLWQMGMPVLTGATSAYSSAMAAAGLDMACATLADWETPIRNFAQSNAAAREAIAGKAQSFALDAYSGEHFRERFDRAFAMAGLEL